VPLINEHLFAKSRVRCIVDSFLFAEKNDCYTSNLEELAYFFVQIKIKPVFYKVLNEYQDSNEKPERNFSRETSFVK